MGVYLIAKLGMWTTTVRQKSTHNGFYQFRMRGIFHLAMTIIAVSDYIYAWNIDRKIVPHKVHVYASVDANIKADMLMVPYSKHGVRRMASPSHLRSPVRLVTVVARSMSMQIFHLQIIQSCRRCERDDVWASVWAQQQQAAKAASSASSFPLVNWFGWNNYEMWYT